MGKIRLTAPEGYKLRDKRNGRTYSEVLTDETNRGRYELVPDTTDPTITEEFRG